MKNVLQLFLLMMPACLLAQQYNVLLIPDSLKKNADMVVRADELVMEIKSPGKANIKKSAVLSRKARRMPTLAKTLIGRKVFCKLAIILVFESLAC